MTTRTAPGLLAGLALLLAAGAASADEALVVPRGGPLALDGRLDEEAWRAAVRLPADRVQVPTGPGSAERLVALEPEVRLLLADGWLCVGVRAAEDPGTAIGIHLLVAAPDDRSAAEAVSLGYRPVELRTPRYVVRGPRGASRAAYRFEGACEFGVAGRWSLEARVPAADLVADAAGAALRVAVVVATRTPNVLAAAPRGSLWSAPAAWTEVRAPEGGWPAAPDVDAERHRREDEADRLRRLAWLDYLRGSSVPVQDHLTKAKVEAHLQELVLAPLDAVAAHRPDLRVPVLVVRGDVQHRLGHFDAAAKDFEDALALAPGWREASFGLHCKVRAVQRSEGPLGGPSDYAARLAELETMRAEKRLTPWAREGVDLALGLLRYKHGDFDQAQALLEALRARFPVDSFIADHAGFAKRYGAEAMHEAGKRAQDAKRELPRASIRTTRGTFVVELFQHVAPNTVNNFVWLAQHGFYAGLAFHRTVPYFLVQGGDPVTRAGHEEARAQLGTGSPGYAIRSELTDRKPLRGMLAMAGAGRDTEGSQFFVTTGTAAHLEGDAVVFGRVVDGMDVVDAVEAGDVIEEVVLERLDPEWTYRPATVAGTPAPEPVDDWAGR